MEACLKQTYDASLPSQPPCAGGGYCVAPTAKWGERITQGSFLRKSIVKLVTSSTSTTKRFQTRHKGVGLRRPGRDSRGDRRRTTTNGSGHAAICESGGLDEKELHTVCAFRQSIHTRRTRRHYRLVTKAEIYRVLAMLARLNGSRMGLTFCRSSSRVLIMGRPAP